jgi:hypothetical protein
MNFYGNRTAAGLWAVLSVFQIVMATIQFQRHGNEFLVVAQLILWPIALLFWIWMGSTRWRFSPAALEQRRIGSAVRSVPYDAIISVDPVSAGRSAERFAIVYGGNMFGQQQRMIIYTSNRTGFLEELERRAPQSSFHV